MNVNIYDTEVLARAKAWHMNIERLRTLFANIEGLDQSQSPLFTFEEDKCHIWTGQIGQSRDNYDQTHYKVQKKTVSAVRCMYHLVYGIPDDPPQYRNNIMAQCHCGKLSFKKHVPRCYMNCCRPLVRHLCMDINGTNSHGKCMNPMHMAIGTHLDNMVDMARHGTASIRYGEDNKSCVYTDEQVMEMVTYHRSHPDITSADLSKWFHINLSIVKRILNGTLRSKLTGIVPIKTRERHFRTGNESEHDRTIRLFWEDYVQKGKDYDSIAVLASQHGISEPAARHTVNGENNTHITKLPKKRFGHRTVPIDEMAQRVLDFVTEYKEHPEPKPRGLQTKLAKKYDITKDMSSKIMTGALWSNVTGIPLGSGQRITKLSDEVVLAFYRDYCSMTHYGRLAECARKHELEYGVAKGIIQGRNYHSVTGLEHPTKKRKVEVQTEK